METKKLRPTVPSIGIYLNLIPGLQGEQTEYLTSIDEIIAGEKLEKAILCNYMFELDWIFQACPALQRCHNVLVIHGHRDNDSIQELNHSAQQWNNVKLSAPSLPIAYGTHHSKMFLGFYDKGIRVCITTANFIQRDWLCKTQGVWVRDFPLKDNPQDSSSDFEQDLVTYYDAVKAFDTAELRKYDFSNANCRIVSSVPGYHSGQRLHTFGHMKMRSLLLSPDYKDGTQAVCQVSSIGSLTEPWLTSELAESFNTLGPGLVVPWPTVDQVRNSLEGWSAGGSLCCPKKNLKPFLVKVMRRWDTESHSARQRAMPHMKSYFKGSKWFLLTSANLSKAAWGALQKKETQLMIRSYEVGVLFRSNVPLIPWRYSCTPEMKTKWAEGGSESKRGILRLVSTLKPASESSEPTSMTIPIPFDQEPKSYSRTDTPWDWDTPRTGKDVYGESW